MRLLKFTLTLFVMMFAFSASAALNCHSLLQDKDVAAEYSIKLLKRAWSEYSLTDSSKEKETENFQIIWDKYQEMIDAQISQLTTHRHLRPAQKSWLIHEMTAELVSMIQTQRVSLRYRWEFSKQFMETDLDRHKELLDEINEEITNLATNEVAWDNTYLVLTKFAPKLNYVDHFRLH